MIVWIIGLSGSGKSTLGKEIVRIVRKKKSNIMLIDGDEFRNAFDNDIGHSVNDRKKNARRISKFCKLCDKQNIHVVCPILSIFPEIRAWNRKNIKNYYEVFIDTPIEDLKTRDPKGLYKAFENKQKKNIVGMDIKFPIPRKSNLIIYNDNSLDKLMQNSITISNKILRYK